MCVCVLKKMLILSGAKQVIFPSAFFQSAKTGWAGSAVSLSADWFALHTRAWVSSETDSGMIWLAGIQSMLTRASLMKGFLVKYCTKSSLPPCFQRYPFRVIPRKGKTARKRERRRGGEGEMAELRGYHNNYTPWPTEGGVIPGKTAGCWRTWLATRQEHKECAIKLIKTSSLCLSIFLQKRWGGAVCHRMAASADKDPGERGCFSQQTKSAIQFHTAFTVRQLTLTKRGMPELKKKHPGA